MSGAQLTFCIEDDRGGCDVAIRIDTLIIAGWTARDVTALDTHIEELAAIGVSRPKAVPMFYRVDAALLTTAETIQVVGRESSGEVEAVLVKHDDTLFVGIGSDHTDRALETVGITLSKQVCAKPVARHLWRWEEVAGHWDQLRLESHLPATNESYQDGETITLRRPDELLALYETREGAIANGTAMFCGTLPAAGGIRFAEQMALTLVDPVRGRAIRHRYAVDVLQVAEA